MLCKSPSVFTTTLDENVTDELTDLRWLRLLAQATQVANGRVRIQTLDSGLVRRDLLGLLFNVCNLQIGKSNKQTETQRKERKACLVSHILSAIKMTYAQSVKQTQ